MRTNKREIAGKKRMIQINWKISFLFVLCYSILISARAQNVFVVNSTGDLEDIDLADLNCADEKGNCTLRAAIQNANKSITKDKVHFNIPGKGPFRISLKTNLPKIVEPIILDASTQPGYSTLAPQIILDGGNIPPHFSSSDIEKRSKGFFLTGRSSGSTIKGFVIGRFGHKNYPLEEKILPWSWGYGIVIDTGDNKVQGNYIGLAADGFSRFSNFWGVAIINSTGRNYIGGNLPEERNVISGNHRVGVFLNFNTTVQGNYIGTSADGNCEVGNEVGISLVYYANGNKIQENLISGNRTGIHLSGENNLVMQNRIGTNAKGTTSISNGTGIGMENSRQNIVGGGNLISGNSTGILINNTQVEVPNNNWIHGNLIGTDVSGSRDIGNQIGILLNKSNYNLIGGPKLEERNIISGNSIAGIQLCGSGYNILQGNFIGTNKAGDEAISNNTGIRFLPATDTAYNISNQISGNLISGNNSDGILFTYASYTSVINNAIGTQKDSRLPLPNKGNGINLQQKAPANCIGGTEPDKANIIGYNEEFGINLNYRELQQPLLNNRQLLFNNFLHNCKADVSPSYQGNGQK